MKFPKNTVDMRTTADFVGGPMNGQKKTLNGMPHIIPIRSDSPLEFKDCLVNRGGLVGFARIMDFKTPVEGSYSLIAGVHGESALYRFDGLNDQLTTLTSSRR